MSQVTALKDDDMPLATERQSRGKYLALGMTLAVHVLLLVLLIVGVRWTTHTNEAVEVELVGATEPSSTVTPPAKPPVLRDLSPAPSPHPEPKTEPPIETKPAFPAHKPDIALKDEERRKKLSEKK